MTGVHVQLAEDDKWPQLLHRDFSSERSQLDQETSYMCDAIRANDKLPPQKFIQDQVHVLDFIKVRMRSPGHTRGQQCCQRRQAGRGEQGPQASTPAHQPLSMGKTTSYHKPETRWGQVFHASKIIRLENHHDRSNLIIRRLNRTSPHSFKKFPCNIGIPKLP